MLELTPAKTRQLIEVLGEARRIGLVGNSLAEDHLEHSLGFAEVVGVEGPPTLLDLGTGAGIPGLILATLWQDTQTVLLDASVRKARFLDWAVSTLGLRGTTTVICDRAESAAHDPSLRQRLRVVTARAFGPPAVTAECAAGFLEVGGRLVVSEPPEDAAWERWSARTKVVGLELQETVIRRRHTYAVLRASCACPAGYPRRTGVPAKRPLY